MWFLYYGHFYGLSALVGCWSSVFIRRNIHQFLNVWHFDYTAFVVSWKLGSGLPVSPHQLRGRGCLYSNWPSLVDPQLLCNRIVLDTFCVVMLYFGFFGYSRAFLSKDWVRSLPFSVKVSSDISNFHKYIRQNEMKNTFTRSYIYPVENVNPDYKGVSQYIEILFQILKRLNIHWLRKQASLIV